MRIASREMSGNRPLKLDLLLTTAFCVLFTLAMASVPACAQENPTGNINGKVTSANGAPIEGARVTITNQSTGQTVAVRTDAAGTFAAVSLPPTDYSFHVDAKISSPPARLRMWRPRRPHP